MLMTLVLTRSYAGNLMALLAVRHISEPYQTLHDVVDDSSVNMIWQPESAYVQFYRSATSGLFHKVGEAEKAGRITHRTFIELAQSVNTLVRRGDHVLMEEEFIEKVFTAVFFTRSGTCDFYLSRDIFYSVFYGMLTHKESPLIPALSDSIMRVKEAGLHDYWNTVSIPNMTSCKRPPTKITVSTILSIDNIWGMFVVLEVGHAVALLVLGLEVLSSRLLHSRDSQEQVGRNA
ncbi:Glutamate receptor ionotropic, kainate 2-like 9 [Homarus americanus]|uniref:Glutamate receptor ionotropic, kainate 2-like 9 n=1 Tax=Homarus americanus TaxID=6706 RepID=A0A8J5JUM0_HOMAM|nr:Glutamate receptor ionotropic, kainate 2-like 9 [Homarus americanus]